jgi:hypothetical protein
MGIENDKLYGPEFQRNVLRLMMLDYGFCSRAASYLKEDFFTAELKWFFRKGLDYFKKYDKMPPEDLYMKEVHLQSEPQKYENIRAEMMAENPLAKKDWIKDEVTGFIRCNLYISGYQEAAQLYNIGNKDGAYDKTKQKVEELMKINFLEEKVSQFGDSSVLLTIAAEQRKNAVPTGIRAIDEAMYGGMYPQTWTTFLGGSNVGKSMLCPNLAYAAAWAGKKTFVTIHEDEEIPTKIRFLARFSGIPINKLWTPANFRTDEENQAIELADKLLKHFVTLRFMYGSDCFLESTMQAVKMQHIDSPFELFLCDYPQCLKTKAFKNIDNSYAVLEYIYSELKQLCLELGIAGAGGAQVNRTGHKISKSGADFLRMHDVGDSWGISKKSSNVITMNRSNNDVLLNRITFLLDKVRNGRAPVAAQCVTDFSRAITYYIEAEKQKEIPVEQGPGGQSGQQASN